MNDMIERVAQAIDTLGNIDLANYQHREMVARAAIAAIREPTQDMILPGYNALMDWDARTGEDYGIAEIWRAMIDAALASPIPIIYPPDEYIMEALTRKMHADARSLLEDRPKRLARKL